MTTRIKWYGDSVLKTLEAELSRRVKRSANELRNNIIRNISSPRRTNGASVPGAFPNKEKGDLTRSITAWYPDQFNAEVGIPKQSLAQKYAKGLELGTTIHARDKLMTVPVSEKARRHNLKGGTSLNFEIPLTKIRRAGRRPILAEIRGSGKRKRIIVHYVLASSVRIEARPYLAPSLEQTIPTIKAIFSEPMK